MCKFVDATFFIQIIPLWFVDFVMLEPLPGGADRRAAFKCKLRPFTKEDQALSRSASFSVHTSLIIMAFLVLDASHEY